jgi:hypothetical protein
MPHERKDWKEKILAQLIELEEYSIEGKTQRKGLEGRITEIRKKKRRY